MIGDSEEIIEAALADLRRDVIEAESVLYDKIIRFIYNLETKAGGKLSKGRDNRRAVLNFDEAVEGFLIDAKMRDVAAEFLSNFDELENIQKGVHKDLNNLSLSDNFLSPYKNWAARKVTKELDNIEALAGTVLEPVRDALFFTIQRGGSLSDLIDEIEALVLSSDDRLGILAKYSTQVTRDTLNGYEGAVNNAVREAYNLNAIKYVGSLVRDSRAQCRRWVNKEHKGESGVILFAELETEINWAYNNGRGMHPGTTPDNFLQHRGGYNCRHSGYPFRI